ncbi:14829_t:CDS:2 [Funneliformis geosporum]|nr:14829_t:CDS:2 [Funneliformis geosporum]
MRKLSTYHRLKKLWRDCQNQLERLQNDNNQLRIQNGNYQNQLELLQNENNRLNDNNQGLKIQNENNIAEIINIRERELEQLRRQQDSYRGGSTSR